MSRSHALGTTFSGSRLDFYAATFSGGEVEMATPKVWTVPPVGVGPSELGVEWPSADHLSKIINKPL